MHFRDVLAAINSKILVFYENKNFLMCLSKLKKYSNMKTLDAFLKVNRVVWVLLPPPPNINQFIDLKRPLNYLNYLFFERKKARKSCLSPISLKSLAVNYNTIEAAYLCTYIWILSWPACCCASWLWPRCLSPPPLLPPPGLQRTVWRWRSSGGAYTIE